MIAVPLFPLLLAVTSVSFDVTATGVEKGTPLEFMFAGRNTDRDYETMFVLDESVDSFCRRLEAAGIPKGHPTDMRSCRFWPLGCAVELKPSLDSFVKSELPEGMNLAEVIYTGGVRDSAGHPEAETNMPAAVFGLYSLAQSPLLFNGIYEQSVVYGCHTAARTLKKGEKVRFTLEWSGSGLPTHLDVRLNPGSASDALKEIKAAAAKGEIEVCVHFDDELTVREAVAASQALSVIDSRRVKINGRPEHGFFYRAFLPLVKWKDRKERLVQPFEVLIGASGDTVTVIEEDWSVEGPDPKLTPRTISFDQASAARYAQVDTCLIYATNEAKIGRLRSVLRKLPKSVINVYVYGDNP